MINTAIANKVTTGSYWLPMVDKRMPQAILDAGEVKVYKLRHDGFIVTVTIIFGEGETSEFDLLLFIEMFVPKYTLSRTTTSDQELLVERAYQASEDQIKRLNSYADIDIDWSVGKKDKAAYAVMCASCGGIISEISESAPAIPHANIYECARCATVTSYQENSPILSAVKRAQIEARLAAMGITEPPPVESKTKPMGRLEAFLNKDPISSSRFTVYYFITVVPLILLMIINPGAPAIIFWPIQIVTIIILVAIIVVDAKRTKNRFIRWIKDQMN